mmetsp:Transcript_59604/g.129024  ORF Transcript_59604/g.129024 Transcript_59604/m.129024 type:complete len:278 (-) Transcript_59604:1135-1968(-)
MHVYGNASKTKNKPLSKKVSLHTRIRSALALKVSQCRSHPGVLTQGLVVLVVPNLPKCVHCLAVLAREGPRGGGVGLDRHLVVQPVKVGRDLALHVVRMRDAGLIFARNIREVVDLGRHLERKLFVYAASLQDGERTSGRHRCQFFQREPCQLVNVEVRGCEKTSSLVFLLASAVHTHTAHAVQAQHRPHHEHHGPDLLRLLVFSDAVNDHAINDRGQAGSASQDYTVGIFGLDLLDKVARQRHGLRQQPLVDRSVGRVGQAWSRLPLPLQLLYHGL